MKETDIKATTNTKINFVISDYFIKKSIILGFLTLGILGLLAWVLLSTKSSDNSVKLPVISKSTPSPTQPITYPTAKLLTNNYHIFQSFNNCGPAALSMALSYYGINKTQEELGQSLRPYQNPQGDNDDKSVTLPEIAKKGEEYGFKSYYRPMGDTELVKKFIAQDIPVVTKTWLRANEDIGHFRVVKGYDDNRRILIQDDSLQGKNLEYAYSDFNEIWKKFNYEFLVLIPQKKEGVALQILGERVKEESAWRMAAENARGENDVYSKFNLSVALYYLKDYQGSVNAFEQVENQLPSRTLWYQIEPIRAYFELGSYDRVFQLSDRILNGYNRAFSELYILRGRIYANQGRDDLARQEFQKAIFYNQNLEEAKTYAL